MELSARRSRLSSESNRASLAAQLWGENCPHCHFAPRSVELNARLYLYKQGLHAGAIFMKPLVSEQRAVNDTHTHSVSDHISLRNYEKQLKDARGSDLSTRARASLSCALIRGESSSGSLAFPAAIFFSSSPAALRRRAAATASDARHDFMESRREIEGRRAPCVQKPQ